MRAQRPRRHGSGSSWRRGAWRYGTHTLGSEVVGDTVVGEVVADREVDTGDGETMGESSPHYHTKLETHAEATASTRWRDVFF